MNEPTPSPTPAPASKPAKSPPSTAGTKRKRGAAGKYYAVKVGYQPGIYYEWKDCLAQITGFKGSVFQAFPTIEEANAFITGAKLDSSGGASPLGAEPSRFYAIQRGHKPGIYTNWANAQEQIKGFQKPRYKKFSTREEAEEFVKLGQTAGIASTETKLPGAPGLTSEIPIDQQGVPFKPAEGPLPQGAEDGFDPNILLDPKTGKIVYKSNGEKAMTKSQPKGPPGMLRIYTDGSSLKNGRTQAAAGVGVYFGPGDERNVSEPLKGSRQTNQRAELTAILRALDIAPRHRDVTIVTDSQYAINCVTVWFQKWRTNQWMTSDKKPVENKDLVESILSKIEERTELRVKTLFEWVKGHASDPGNQAADRLAVNGAQRAATQQTWGGGEAARDVPGRANDKYF